MISHGRLRGLSLLARVDRLALCLLALFFISANIFAYSEGEVRALWVVRTTLTSPEKIRLLVNSAADNGFNTLIVQVRGRGDAYYKSRVEPRAVELKDQPQDFDPLAFTITEAHVQSLVTRRIVSPMALRE